MMIMIMMTGADSKFFVCLCAGFHVRVLGHVSVRLDLCHLRFLPPRRRRRRRSAPPRLLLRVLLRFAVRWQWTRRVDRRVVHPADFEVRLVVSEELFPMFHALLLCIFPASVQTSPQSLNLSCEGGEDMVCKCVWGGVGGRMGCCCPHLELAFREPTQIMRAMFLEAPCPERACGVHACPNQRKNGWKRWKGREGEM